MLKLMTSDLLHASSKMHSSFCHDYKDIALHWFKNKKLGYNTGIKLCGTLGQGDMCLVASLDVI